MDAYRAPRAASRRLRAQLLRRAADPTRETESPEGELLRLQRQAGNRAVTSLMNGSGGIQIQRQIPMTVADLEKGRGVGGRLVSFVIRGKYAQIVEALRDYHETKRTTKKLNEAIKIATYSREWLDEHDGNASDDERVQHEIVSNLESHAMKEVRSLRGDLKYEDLLERPPEEGGFKGLSPQARYSVLESARDVHAGRLPKSKNPFAGTGEEAIRVAAEANLSVAEIAAIRVTTMPDYVYVNASTSSTEKEKTDPSGAPSLRMNERRVEDKIKSSIVPEIKAADPKLLADEGSAHAAMAVKGMSKLRLEEGKFYRGFRCSPAEFKKWYVNAEVVSRPQLDSASKDESVAKKYADGQGGDITPKPDETVSVMCEVHVTSARDISKLSAAKKAEEEVTILPGTKFFITNVIDRDKGSTGYPSVPATEWHTIILVEMPKELT